MTFWIGRVSPTMSCERRIGAQRPKQISDVCTRKIFAACFEPLQLRKQLIQWIVSEPAYAAR